VKAMKIVSVLLMLTMATLAAMAGRAIGHDKNHPITPQQKSWFDSLKSGKGPCCADADGNVLTDNDWESRDGHYRVFIEGAWYDVPDEAVVKVPNMYGPTMVWPIRIWNMGGGLKIEIRCFMPGMMT